MSEKLMLALEIGGGAILIYIIIVIGIIINARAFLAWEKYDIFFNPNKARYISNPHYWPGLWRLDTNLGPVIDLVALSPLPSQNPEEEVIISQFVKAQRLWRMYWLVVIVLVSGFTYLW